ncbi:glutathione S-transferase family protein [Thiosulfatihalobacter marinus]|uniref:glutathione S-transferase family protein n=1 Tax=Thiosulfatihalobacter marinus TaxID=2792481 RepID=UPI0018D600B0
MEPSAHKSGAELHLYHGATSVCSAKVRLGLAELGLGWTGQILDLGAGEQNAQWYVRLNPKGVVPTLLDGDLVVADSSVILEHLAEKLPDSTFVPKDTGLRVRSRMWLADCIDIHAAINTLTYSTAKRRQILASKSPEEIEAALAGMTHPANAAKRRDILANGMESVHVMAAFFALRLMFDRMQADLETSRWLAGDSFSIADAAIVAYVDRLDRLGLGGLWNGRTPKVGDWLDAARARKSYGAAIEAFAGPCEADREKSLRDDNWAMVSQKWTAYLGGA